MEQQKQLGTGNNDKDLLRISKISPKQYWTIIAPKTAKEAVNGIGTSLSIMRKDLGEVVAKAFLTFIVTELIESFNVGKTMNDMQVVFAVNGIQEDYFFLKPEELKFCFDKAKKGKYGTMYDRIDAAVIFGWIEEFLIERTQVCIDQNIEQAKSFKIGEINPIYEKLFKEIVKRFPEGKNINMDLITPVPRERTEEEKIIQDILKEFDELRGFDPGIKFVTYNKKHYSQSEFLYAKIEELNKLNKIEDDRTSQAHKEGS